MKVRDRSEQVAFRLSIDYFDLNSVGGSGESALLQAGCEVVGEITWVCRDEVDLSAADLSGMNLRFARTR